MAGKKFDGLIEAVRYAADGKIEMVRLYERRGATFSDVVLLNRSGLVERLKNGKTFVTGSRKAYMSSTFDIGKDVQLSGGDLVSTGNGREQLEGVPLF